MLLTQVFSSVFSLLLDGVLNFAQYVAFLDPAPNVLEFLNSLSGSTIDLVLMPNTESKTEHFN